MRGHLDPKVLRDRARPDCLTLTERNYFTFARHTDRLVPNYVVRQLAGRGLWFLGSSAGSWEDRLLVDALLEHRRKEDRPVAVSHATTPYEHTYWQYHNALLHETDLLAFVGRLREFLPS